jgi:3-hexulose-6-phosphate synthase
VRSKIQLAIDTITPDQAVALIEKVAPYIDIIEAGTPFIKLHGLGVLKRFRQAAPEKLIVADMKAMDAGAYEATIAFDAGADMMTVLGGTTDDTLRGAVQEANKRGLSVVADLIAVPDKVARAKQLADLGVHYVGVHTGLDQQAAGETPLADLQEIRAAVQTPIAVAGGINVNTIRAIASFAPAIIVIGGSITAAADPVATAKALHVALNQ